MKKRYIIGAVILGAMVLGMATGDKEEYNYVDVSTLGNDNITEKTEPELQYIDVTSFNLMAEYEENEASANMKYKDKPVRVTGEVTGVGEMFDQYFVKLKGNKQIGFEVQCFVSDDWESYIANLKKGDTVTIKGICDGKSLNVAVKDCIFE